MKNLTKFWVLKHRQAEKVASMRDQLEKLETYGETGEKLYLQKVCLYAIMDLSNNKNNPRNL